MSNAPIIIAGAGPVGMCAALALARRGVNVLLLEAQAEGTAADAKCNTVASRTLETLRRFGLADAVREAGLPDDFPTDVLYATSVAGPELTRIGMPSRTERAQADFTHGVIDAHWRTSEPCVRVSQIYFNPILMSAIKASPRVQVRHHMRVTGYQQTDDAVQVTVENAAGETELLHTPYLIAADGARSAVRHAMGVRLTGDAELGRIRSTLIDAPGLKGLFGQRRAAWMTWVVNHKVRGVVVAIDGQSRWLVHRQLPPGEKQFEALDADQSIRDVLGVGGDFDFKVLHHEDWIGRRLVAERMRDGRVFLAGDAAHLWVPFAGYGMNAGIADGVSIAWLLANVLQGWAGPHMLDAYEAERQPITEQVSRHAMQAMLDSVAALGEGAVPAALSSPYNPAGLALRKLMGAKLHKLNVPQFAPEGLNFGYYYDASPIIVHGAAQAPDYSMGKVTPSTVPGCRLPHFWIAPGVSAYDRLSPVYTLLRFDPTVSVDAMFKAAQEAAMPLTLLDTAAPPGDAAFTHRLLIVREDQHIAWRGDALPDDVAALVAVLCGHGASKARP